MDEKDFYEMFVKAQNMIKSGNVPPEVQNMMKSGNVPPEVQNMMKSGNVPPEMQNMIKNSNLSHGFNNVKNSDRNSDANNISSNYDSNNINRNNNSNVNINSNKSSNVNNGGFDINTMMNIQKMMSMLNSKSDDDLTNLLFALKPYLRNEKKEKIDEYVKLFRMGKMAELWNKMNSPK